MSPGGARAGAAAGPARCLVVAKAPVPGRCKTRLGAEIGMDAAARVAAAALLDTVRTCTATFGASRCILALAGDLGGAIAGDRVAAAIAGWSVVPQRGAGLGARLARAHRDAGPGPVVQIGMDTPQLTPVMLWEAEAMLADHDAVLGPAQDGGWWVLALREPARAEAVATVAMSTAETCAATRTALESVGLTVGLTRQLVDVDTVADATTVAHAAPDGEFARTWSQALESRR